MKKTRRLLCISIALALASPAMAQDEKNKTESSWRPEATTLDEVVVQGQRETYRAEEASVTRSGVPLIEVPQSIQVLTRKLLDEQDLQTPSDALANVSGVVVARPQEAVLADYTLRGFVSEMYVDGLPSYGCTAVADPGTLYGFERIEVAKGPTATIFGGGLGSPVGGIINMVSKTPTGSKKGCVALRVGSDGLVNPKIDIDQPLSDTVAVRLAAEYVSGGDFIDAVETDRIAVHPSLRWNITPDTDLLIRGTYTNVEALEYSGLPAAVLGQPGVDLYRFTGTTLAPKATNKNTMLTAVLDHRFSEKLSGQVQARHYENEFREYASFIFTAWFPPVTETAFPLLSGFLPTDVEQDTVDAGLTGRFTTGNVEHVLLGGVQWDRTRYDASLGTGFFPLDIADFAVDRSGYDLPFGDTPAPYIFQSDVYRTTAGYLQDQMTIGEKLHVLAGLRWSQIEVDSFGYDRKMTNTSPRIGASYEVAKGVALFGGYAEGFRGIENFIPSPGHVPKPETSQSYEAGMKLNLANGLSGTLALYQLTRQNVPTQDPQNLGGSVQTGEQRSKGFEADLVWEPSDSWSFLASYAYTDAELTKDNTFPVGSSIPRVPKNAGRIAGRYRFSKGDLKGFALGAGVTASQGAEVTLPASYVTAGFGTVDVQASYEFGPWKMGVSVVNLLDKEYVLPYQYLAQSVVIPGQPRSAFITLSYCY